MPTIDEIIKKDTIYNINFKLLDSALMFDPITCLYAFLDDAEIERPSYLPTGNDYENSLAFLYVTSHSGEKYISNYVLKTYDIVKKLNPSATDGERYNYLIITIGNTLFLKYNENWQRIYDALFADYNPIQNYDSIEEITRSGDDKVSMNTDTTETMSHSGDDKVSMNTDTTETMSHSGDDKTSNNIDNKQTEKVSAYNSSTLLDNKEVSNSGLASNNYSQTDYNSEVETTRSGLASKNYSQTDYNSEVETTRSGLASNNYSKTDYNSKVKTTKSGNIGVTTSQQMIESELQLRKNKFWEIVFNDCDEIFTNNLYFMKD